MSDEQQQPQTMTSEDAALIRIENFLARVQDQYTAAEFARLVCHEYEGRLPDDESERLRLWQEARNKVRAVLDVWQQEHGGQPATEFGVYSSVHLWLMGHFSAGHDLTAELCNRIHDRAAELDRRNENGGPEPEAQPAAEEPQNDAD